MRGWGTAGLTSGMLFGTYIGARQAWYSIFQLRAPRLVWDAHAMEWLPGINWWELMLAPPPVCFWPADIHPVLHIVLFGDRLNGPL
jgi:hypothetical protein